MTLSKKLRGGWWRGAKAGPLSHLGQTIINIATVTEVQGTFKFSISDSCKRMGWWRVPQIGVMLIMAMHLTFRAVYNVI